MRLDIGNVEARLVASCVIQMPHKTNLAMNGWEVCYQAAVFELDDDKLRVKIDDTRYAIDQRLEASLRAHTALGMKERRDMSNALEVLLVLERFLGRHTKAGRPAA